MGREKIKTREVKKPDRRARSRRRDDNRKAALVPRRKKKKADPTTPIVDMPARGATEKILIAYFDVTSLADAELDALRFEIHQQHEPSPVCSLGLSHPLVPQPTFALRTMKYSGGMCVAMDERDLEGDL
jgi:hypothetical protein